MSACSWHVQLLAVCHAVYLLCHWLDELSLCVYVYVCVRVGHVCVLCLCAYMGVYVCVCVFLSDCFYVCCVCVCVCMGMYVCVCAHMQYFLQIFVLWLWDFFINISIIWIYVMSCVRLAGWLAIQVSCISKLLSWTLQVNCSTKFFHTCHAYRHHLLLPFYSSSLTFTLPGSLKVSSKQNLMASFSHIHFNSSGWNTILYQFHWPWPWLVVTRSA